MLYDFYFCLQLQITLKYTLKILLKVVQIRFVPRLQLNFS